jgi:TonB-linked SusC/RagA family outer membrane protein
MTKIITHFTRRVFTGSVLLLMIGYHTNAQELNSQDSIKNLSIGNQHQEIKVLYGSKPKKYITGAVSSISGEVLSNIPGTNRLSALSGRLAGLSIIQGKATPGAESISYQIRGFHNLNGSDSPWIIVNGRLDDVSQIEPNDIESITVLKDAAATALYGMNASQGIIIVTTKRGKVGKLKINYNVESTFQQPTRMPKFLDAYNYAVLYNEAQLNDNPLAVPKYNATALQAYQDGSNPYLYPNVDWSDELVKDNSLQIRNNINVSGGAATAKYYFSASYLTDNGIFKTDKSINKYNTNSNLDLINVRASVDLKIAKNLTIFADLRSKRDKRNAPGAYNTLFDENLFNSIYATPSNAYPMKNADGSLGGTLTYQNNPYGGLNYAGYNNIVGASMSSFAELNYDFNSLLKGLTLKARVGFSSISSFYTNRSKNFAVYSQNPSGSATPYTQFGATTSMVSAGAYINRNRIYDHSFSMNYNSVFGNHNISSMLMYERQQFDTNSGDGNLVNSGRQTKNYQGPKGSISYRFKDRYLLDVVASYMGNEQYPESNRYGFFPAVSAGWIVSDESFMKGSIFDFLKIRGSYGRTGNVPPGDLNFNYYGSYAVAAGYGAYFGTTPTLSSGVYQNQIANPLVTWEKTLKSNAGLDIALLNNKFNASFDYFNEETKDILISGDITVMYGGGSTTSVPSGIFKNKGFEVQAGWTDKIKDFQYSITANYSFAKNKVIENGEVEKQYPWMQTIGNPLLTRMGYVFDRFYTETDNIASLPSQSSLGTQKPGDLKYKDLNNDGIINENDITVIGKARIPQSNFGLNLGAQYKGFDLNVFFHGTQGGTTYNSGRTYYAFVGQTGNALEHHLDRWTPGSGQSAAYPRLSLTNTNNTAVSSYWVKDNSFVRLKYAELGYTFPASLVGKIGMTGSRIFVNGNNLFLWDDVKLKDPETENPVGYPLLRSFSVGLNVKF